ncbi:PIN domain-containing protein [Flavobacterium sp.]|uniref:type II toxin-antitoxin system VapC family toxin n=1 Tax=Flavobacterium sp. TaxID=239 RepID=UPI00120C51E3|nr:PIN domain-containing protein [Flavobacterium sp.]RZJ71803.1 MAG: PIN domain-containing protein [Flavobacterium sp.]
MKKVFLDTNIIIDLIADRKPFSKYAAKLFQLAEESELQLFTSSHAIATTHNILKKYVDEKSLREILYDLLDFLAVIPVTDDVIKRGLRSSHKDFEDAIQIVCASSITGIDAIITRDVRDFKGSEIPVMSPEAFFL